jgi:hypothetical protein
MANVMNKYPTSTVASGDVSVASDAATGSTSAGSGSAAAGYIGCLPKPTLLWWQMLENVLNPTDRAVLECVKEQCASLIAGNSLEKKEEKTHRVLGSQFVQILPFLVEAGFIKAKTAKTQPTQPVEEPKKKKAPKPGSKAAQEATRAGNNKAAKIVAENTTAIIEKEVQTTLVSFNGESQPPALRSVYIEMRMVGFVQVLHHLHKNKTDANTTKAFALIVAAERFLRSLETITCVGMSGALDVVAPEAVEMLHTWIDKVKKDYSVNVLAACEKTPELTTSTPYDFALPEGGISLYEHQTKTLQMAHTAMVKGESLLLRLLTSFGTGKTTIAAAIALMAHKLEKQMIFCCSTLTVIEQVGNLAYNIGVPFAVAYMDEKEGLKISENYNCMENGKVVKIPSLVLCSADSVLSVLETSKFSNAMLFFDEPTFGLDTLSVMAQEASKVLHKLPKITILSSATLPEQCPEWILENHLQYGTGVVHDIKLDKTLVGVELYTMSGEMALPHNGCKTRADLMLTISNVRSKAVIRRAYTAPVMQQLYQLLTDKKIAGLPDMQTEFADITTFSADSVCRMALRLLECLAASSDAVIADVCAVQFHHPAASSKNAEESESSDEDDDVVYEKTPAIPSQTDFVELTTLGTTSAWIHPGTTLIATPECVRVAETAFTPLFNGFSKKYTSVKMLLEKFSRSQDTLAAELKRLEDAKMTEIQKLQMESEIQGSKKSLSIAPFEINTSEHWKKYAVGQKTILRSGFSAAKLRQILEADLGVTEMQKVLLACGVGIISPEIRCSLYNSIVSELFVTGTLAYVIADVGVAYGTNVPLSGIIVTKEFSDKYSYNTVCQLMARVGRVGKSWKGEVYVADTLREAIISEMRSTSKALDIESANLEQFHQDFLAEKSKKNTNLDKLLEMIKTAKRLKEQMETERIREEAEKAKLEAEAKRREEEAKRLEAEKAATSVANDEALAAQRKAARRSGRPNTQLASAITSEPLAPKPSPFSRAPAGTPKRR